MFSHSIQLLTLKLIEHRDKASRRRLIEALLGVSEEDIRQFGIVIVGVIDGDPGLSGVFLVEVTEHLPVAAMFLI